MKKQKCYQFTYFYGTDPLLHFQRDCASFIELTPLLSRKGYEFNGALFNFPSENGISPVSKDVPLLRKGELLVMTTRPPLNDHEEKGQHEITRSGTALETMVCDSLESHISYCSRKDVILSPAYSSEFKKGYKDRCSTTYTKNAKINKYLNNARFQATVDERKKIREWTTNDSVRTGAYLIYIREAWTGGPDLLVCFSITGSCSLIWAYLLRTKFSHLLDRPTIAMAEINIGAIPDRPSDLSFTHEWKVHIVLDHKL